MLLRRSLVPLLLLLFHAATTLVVWYRIKIDLHEQRVLDSTPAMTLPLDFSGFQELRHGTRPSSRIPNIIWTYWHGDQLPKTIKLSVQTWRIANPSYNITVLTKRTLPQEYRFILNLRHAKSPQQIADYVRIHVVADYGGIWIDSSSVTVTSLDWIHAHQAQNDAEFVGYYLNCWTWNRDWPVVENWFFAAVPKSPFVLAWRDVFMTMHNYYFIAAYVADLEKNYHMQGIALRMYCTMHLAQQKVIQSGVKYNLALMEAESGPFRYLTMGDWSPTLSTALFFKGAALSPLVKFRSHERKKLDIDRLQQFISTYVSSNASISSIE